MKKLLILLTLICILLTGCGQKTDFSSTLIVPSKDIEEPFRLAETECERMFAHLPDFDITGANVGGRSDESNALVVEFEYTSETESGVYGFLVDTDENGDYYIVSHSKTVTIEMLEG